MSPSPLFTFFFNQISLYHERKGCRNRLKCLVYSYGVECEGGEECVLGWRLSMETLSISLRKGVPCLLILNLSRADTKTEQQKVHRIYPCQQYQKLKIPTQKEPLGFILGASVTEMWRDNGT